MRKIPLYIFITCLFGGMLSFSPDETVNPVPGEKYSIQKAIPETFTLISPDTASFVIPMRRAGRLFVMEATIDGVTGNLIFDTGATGLVLNRTYFRDHVSSGELSSSGITGSAGQVERITANKLETGGLEFGKLSANLADLGHIENRRGIKVLGLFGFSLLKSFEITFDVAKNRLILNPIDKKGNLLNSDQQFKADMVNHIDIAGNIVFVRARIGDKLLRFCFDSGAETNALSSSLNKSVLQTVSITRTVKLKGAGSVSREVIYGVMNDFHFGDSPLNSMETIITYMDHLNDVYSFHIDGVLGFDFISKGNFCFNFVKETMGISFIKPSGQ